jgi:DNA-binding CsgD family transcriptional regulator
MEQEARDALARVRQEGLDQYRSTLWVASLSYLADAASLVGDEATARLLYPELTPLSGGNVIIGHGVASYGAADRFLGQLAATLGEHETAVEHLERALAANRAMGADTWVAHTLYEFGRTLRMRRRPEDEAPAAALLFEAATLAERIGMPVLLARAQALGARTTPPGALPDDLSWREVHVLRLVAAGMSNREIGQELSISGHTVANHVRSILRKTGAANRTEAAGYAHRNALLDPAKSR